MKIVILEDIDGIPTSTQLWRAGRQYDLPADLAGVLIGTGKARQVDAPAAEIETTAARPATKRKRSHARTGTSHTHRKSPRHHRGD